MDTDKEFKLGVYLKPNGNLVTIEENVHDDGRKFYIVLDGKRNNSRLCKLLLKPQDRSLIGWESSNLRLGWGPSKYLNNCEYLGEL